MHKMNLKGCKEEERYSGAQLRSVNPSWQMMWSVSSEIPNPQIGGKVDGKVNGKIDSSRSNN